MKSLRDRRRSLLWWSMGLVALTIIVLLFYPMVREQREQLERLIESFPKELLMLFTGGDLAESMLSPVGYLKGRLFLTLVPLTFLALSIGFGARAIAGEEEQGTLDLLLANPVSRRRVVLDKFAALVLQMLLLGIVFWLALLIGASVVDMEIGGGALLSGTLSAVLLGLEFGALALALGAASGRVGLSLGLSSALAVASFFLNGLAPLADWLSPYQKVSPFYHYIGYDPLQNGLDTGYSLLMLGLSLALLAASLVAFERRDLGV